MWWGHSPEPITSDVISTASSWKHPVRSGLLSALAAGTLGTSRAGQCEQTSSSVCDSAAMTPGFPPFPVFLHSCPRHCYSAAFYWTGYAVSFPRASGGSRSVLKIKCPPYLGTPVPHDHH